MSVGDFFDGNGSDVLPIQSAVIFAGNFFVIGYDNQAVRMLHIKGKLFIAVCAKLMKTDLGKGR